MASNLKKIRDHIATQVRSLRKARGWTLEDLAGRLEVSPSRLSEIERGSGSFSAEQFLTLLTLFNVPATHFSLAPPAEAIDQLQNALARLGATNLQENRELTPTERLRSAHQAVREALVEGSPRLVTATAPVLVRNINNFNLAQLHAELADVGYERRLGWAVDNTLEALRSLPLRARLTEHARAELFFAAGFLHGLRDSNATVEDILDQTIRSQKTLEQVRREASPISKSWNIVTTIQPDDFARALRESLGQH